MDPLFEFLWWTLLVLIVVTATWPLVPCLIVALVAFGVALVGSFAALGILLAFLTVWLSRNVLLSLLPIRLDPFWIWVLFLFWFSLPIVVAPVLWNVSEQYCSNWDTPWKWLHILSTLSYLGTSYTLLVKWQPGEPQWLQFIAVWSAYQMQHRMNQVETELDIHLISATRQYFRRLGKHIPLELQLQNGQSHQPVSTRWLSSGEVLKSEQAATE